MNVNQIDACIPNYSHHDYDLTSLQCTESPGKAAISQSRAPSTENGGYQST